MILFQEYLRSAYFSCSFLCFCHYLAPWWLALGNPIPIPSAFRVLPFICVFTLWSTVLFYAGTISQMAYINSIASLLSQSCFLPLPFTSLCSKFPFWSFLIMHVCIFHLSAFTILSLSSSLLSIPYPLFTFPSLSSYLLPCPSVFLTVWIIGLSFVLHCQTGNTTSRSILILTLILSS